MDEDLIRRSDAIKIAKEFWYKPDIAGALAELPAIEPKTKVIAQVTFDEEKLREIVKEAVERFKEEYEIEPKRGEWIPCSERLPDDSREVLISLEWGIDIGTYERGEWRSEWINHYDDDNVLAWMPLPKPWKGADDETD